MKKIGLGITILLFGILLELTMNLGWISPVIGIVGLVFSVWGFFSTDTN